MPLQDFHPAVARWFADATFGEPTAAQAAAWPAIARASHTLIAAPTGSGKTLAAFLAAIDALVRQGRGRHARGPGAGGLRVAAEGAVERHPPQSRAAAGRHAARSCRRWACPRPRSAARCAPATRRRPSARRMRKRAAAHPGDHARVAVHAAQHRIGPQDAGKYAQRHRRRDPRRGRRPSAARTSRCRWSGWRTSPATRLQRMGLSATQKPIDEVARFLVGTDGGELRHRR